MTSIYDSSFVTIFITSLIVLAEGDHSSHSLLFDGPPIHTFQAFINSPPPSDTSNREYSAPTKLYPVYLKLIKNLSTTTDTGVKIRNRDDFVVNIGISKRQSRHHKIKKNNGGASSIPRNSTKLSKSAQTKLTKSAQTFTKSRKSVKNSAPPPPPTTSQRPKYSSTSTARPTKFRASLNVNPTQIDPPLPLPSPNFPQPHVYTVTIIRRKSATTPVPEAVIMVRNSSSQTTSNNDEKPPDIVYAPTGDTSELDDDYDEDEEEEEAEEEGEVDVVVDGEDDKAAEESSEEANEDKDGNDSTSLKSKENVSSDVSNAPQGSPEVVKVVPTKVTAPKLTSATPVKGDKGSIVLQADSGKKKRRKKKKKKGKKKRRPQFHFVPAPLGPKADLMIRLDKVHHNVKNIVSVVKGVFTDYVVNRPYVDVELYKGVHAHTYKMGMPPPVNIKYDRSNIRTSSKIVEDSHSRPTGNSNVELFSWPNKYPGRSNQKNLEESVNDQQQLSKRFLEDCADEEDCEIQESPKPKRRRPKPRPQSSQKRNHLPLPYPLYVESLYDDSNEDDPFKNLPPMRPSQFLKTEKNWVKTWDKDQTGLPPIVGAHEASMETRRKKKKRSKKKKRKH